MDQKETDISWMSLYLDVQSMALDVPIPTQSIKSDIVIKSVFCSRRLKNIDIFISISSPNIKSFKFRVILKIWCFGLKENWKTSFFLCPAKLWMPCLFTKSPLLQISYNNSKNLSFCSEISFSLYPNKFCMSSSPQHHLF